MPAGHRRSGAVPLRVQQRKPVEEKIGRSRWFRRRRCPARRIRRLANAVAGAEATGGDRRGQRLQIGHARNADIERLEPFGRLEQQGWGVSATVDGELDLTAQQLYLGALELVQRSGLCDGDQSECRVECAGLVLGLGRGERPARPSRGSGVSATARSKNAAAAANPPRA